MSDLPICFTCQGSGTHPMGHECHCDGGLRPVTETPRDDMQHSWQACARDCPCGVDCFDPNCTDTRCGIWADHDARKLGRERLRLDVFAKTGAELHLERVSDDMALVRLNIGHMSFGIGHPRNGLEAASVMRTFRDALTDLLIAAKEAAKNA